MGNGDAVTFVVNGNAATASPSFVYQQTRARELQQVDLSIATFRTLAFTQPAITRASHRFALGVQPQVDVLENGSRAFSDSSSVALSLTGGTAGAILTCSGSVTRTASQGRAFFAGCAIDRPGQGYRFRVTAGDLSFDGPAFDVGWAGDANGDCQVDIQDFSLLLRAFGKLPGAGYEAGPDFNGDSRADIVDFSVLLTMFGSRCS